MTREAETGAAGLQAQDRALASTDRGFQKGLGASRMNPPPPPTGSTLTLDLWLSE